MKDVYLITGTAHGYPVWHYMRISPHKQPMLTRLYETRNVDCTTLGEVLCSGWGSTPPDDIVKRFRPLVT